MVNAVLLVRRSPVESRFPIHQASHSVNRVKSVPVVHASIAIDWLGMGFHLLHVPDEHQVVI